MIISVCNQKGGVGKTSSTIELACAFKKLNKSVLVIDFDQQCNLTSYTLGQTDEQKTIYNVLKAEIPISEAIHETALFDLIPATSQLSLSDEIFSAYDSGFLLADALDYVKDYDIIIIDNSPARGRLLNMAYIASDYIIIPTECDEGSKTGILAIENDLNKLVSNKRMNCHAKVIAYILTKYERTLMHEIALEDLKELSQSKEQKPIIAIINKGIIMSKVKTLRTSVVVSNSGSSQARSYFKLAEDIIKKIGE